MIYSNRKLTRCTDLAYAVTGHNGQGATVNRGLAIFTGMEPRQWLYVAMTRGRLSNIALVQRIARMADPNPKTRPDPELERAEAVERERAGLPPRELSPEEQAERELNEREPIAIMAEALGRDDAEDSATEYARRSLSNADHTGVLGSRWDDLANRADRERYTAALHGRAAGRVQGPADQGRNVAVAVAAAGRVRRSGRGRSAAGGDQLAAPWPGWRT